MKKVEDNNVVMPDFGNPRNPWRHPNGRYKLTHFGPGGRLIVLLDVKVKQSREEMLRIVEGSPRF